MSTIGRQFSNRHVSKLSGYAPALPTPFDDDDRIDGDAFELLCDLQIRSGATALVVCGTTGEASCLLLRERSKLIEIAVDIARGRVPVIAGAGSNDTERAVELTKDAEAHGADAILSVVPYYNRPAQAGLYKHFRTIAALTGLPVILYDVPSRTGCALADETIARLTEAPPHIVGLKDASGDITRPARLRPLVGQDFRLLSGDDATALGFLANGGNGCISVTSNVAPALCRNAYAAWSQMQSVRALRLARVAGDLTAALFVESNPAPLKYALSLFGLMSPHVRLPLVGLSEHAKEEVRYVLQRLCCGYAGSMIGNIGDRPRERDRALALCVERDLI
ncbi:MAG: 4-hydroxy-tetrahydrodipicolinate synthase [Xanthobacteraceae bacterium]